MTIPGHLAFALVLKPVKKARYSAAFLIRRRYLINLFGLKLIRVYDILCAKDFNPNERTGEVFSTGYPLILLPEQLRRSVVKFYKYRANINKENAVTSKPKKETTEKKKEEYLYQCPTALQCMMTIPANRKPV